jgi:biotin carboxyl carrier protein
MARLKSPLTGILAYQNAEEGSIVAAGEAVCQIECMKTLWPIDSPIRGRVHYLVRLGDMVTDDEPVVDIVPEGP